QLTSDKQIQTIDQVNLIQSALSIIYQYPKFRELQEEGIKSFVANNDTLILLPTGGGKTLCILAGIPSAGIYATTGQSSGYQSKVFEDKILLKDST
ncbi:9105_t:CDS:2, partial [Entrophospora sp. SA101]